MLKKYAIAGMLALIVLGVTLAQTVGIPKDARDWYTDTITILTKLGKDAGAAKTAKAVATAFDTATAGLKSKKIADRYIELETKYPQLFSDEEDMEGTDIPAEWVEELEKFAEAWTEYGAAMQNVMNFAADAAVQKSLEAFQLAIDAIAPSEEADDEYDAETAATESE